jgi:hypothetical protein
MPHASLLPKKKKEGEGGKYEMKGKKKKENIKEWDDSI